MDVNITPSFLYILFCFLLIWVVARKTLFARLNEILSERHEKIAAAQEAASGNEAFITEKMNTVQTQLSDARATAFAQRQQLKNEANDQQKELVENARQEATAKVESAQTELATALTEAREQLETETQQIAEEIGARLLGRAV